MKIYSKHSSEVHQSEQRINFSSVRFFGRRVLAWFIEVIISLQTCYSFIYPSVCVVDNFVLWCHYQSINGKYLWCFQYCLFLSLGQDNLFYPKCYRIFAVYQWIHYAISSTKFYLCFCLSLDQDNYKVLTSHHLRLYIGFLCNCFHLMNCQCHACFNFKWVVFLARIFVADLHYLQLLQVNAFPISPRHLG